MSNFYTDNRDLKFHLEHPLMKKIVALKERNFTEKEKFDYAPLDFEDAMDSYNKVLEVVGEITGDIIASNAEGIDHDGPELHDGRVKYATVPYVMAADIVTRADCGFTNIWGLQDCAETINEFATEEQKMRFLTRVCNGETMAMDLTEPDAGSDLQSVMLKASLDGNGNWVLNGVKRFITNGDGDIHLVLARSEEGTHDGRGLSMFIYDKRNGGVNVRRIENKMGIKGSPTCELVYKNAPAELVGSRKLGLIKYVMALMNGARLGIAAQSVGVCEAAYREALAYAKDRKQFGKAIIEFPAVYEMLSDMKAKLDAARTLLYETSRMVDVYKTYDHISEERSLTKEEKEESKKYQRWADMLTPLAKGLSSEFANQNAYDAIQIHGGSGFMKDYPVERIYRDARITSIYEGTTQLQVVAAIRYVTNGSYLTRIKEFEALEIKPELEGYRNILVELTAQYEMAVKKVVDAGNPEFIDFHARRMVEMAGYIIMSHLLVQDANRDHYYWKTLEIFLKFTRSKVAANAEFIKFSSVNDLGKFKIE
jgi:alkylation response protein AidB-like acyl-CoA dehydrogenase